MSGFAWAAMGLVLGLALPGAFLLLRQRSLGTAPGTGGARGQAGGATPQRVQGRDLGRFRAVAIRPGLECCTASEALAGKRMLGREAPLLPLPDCDQSQCHCTYVHFSDRRAGEDRRSAFGSFGGFGPGTTANKERREVTDRRERTGHR
jgi:hypothetical protein